MVISRGKRKNLTTPPIALNIASDFRDYGLFLRRGWGEPKANIIVPPLLIL